MIEPALLLMLTLGLYWAFRLFQARVKSPLVNPVLLAVALLVPLLLWLDIPYDRYMVGGQVLNALLEPAVVALAYPMYQQLDLIRAQWRALLTTCVLGVLLALTLTLALAWALGADKTVALSMAPKAVTTPIAMGISQQVGGIASLTAVLVIIAGIAGAVLGPWLLDKVKVNSPQARGLAMGCAAHAIGTARMVDEGPEAAAFSGLALSLCGLITALVAPWLLPLLTEWMP